MAYKKIELQKIPSEEEFYQFVDERTRIWFRKEVLEQPAPWTDDKILRRFHFCNIYRKYDKGTRWAIENIILPNEKAKTYKNMIFQAIAYRCCNLPSTFEALGLPKLNDDLGSYIEKMKGIQDRGVPIFSTAYRAASFGATPRLEIYLEILSSVREDIKWLTNAVFKCSDLGSAWKAIGSFWGMGPFIANEVLLDLRSGKWGILYQDDPFVNLGPGAEFGLEMMYGKLPREEYIRKLFYLRDLQHSLLPHDYPGDPLHVSDVQFSMCEFRKYISLINGGGKSRRYIPQNNAKLAQDFFLT